MYSWCYSLKQPKEFISGDLSLEFCVEKNVLKGTYANGRQESVVNSMKQGP